MAGVPACELCTQAGGVELWRDDRLRVVRVEDPDHPSFCRVVWNDHVKEFTDLAPADREYSLHVVCAVELSLRHLLQPDKINLASLGNMTPHLHWHVIPRFSDDRHFPNPVWGVPQREHQPVPASRHFKDEVFRQKLVDLLGGAFRE
jgi:diadenosine tetraphosphate (Ap4A) HIT family hydrolase